MRSAVDLLKSAVELNLRYSSVLMNLAKDYLKDASEVVTLEPPAAAPAPTPVPTPAPAPAPRAPLLVVGRSGETGCAAFALNNPGDKPIAVHLVVQGELGDGRVRIEPAHFTLGPGEQGFVRILVPLDDQLPEGADHAGQVLAPGLSSQGVPFIVRRLPGAMAAQAQPKASKARSVAHPAAPRGRRRAA